MRSSLPPVLRQVERTYVLHGRRKLIYFAGCDYFRLASHPRVQQALRQGLARFGLNVAASRWTTGNHELYGRLEKALASFLGAPCALLVPNGYLTNLAVAQAYQGHFTHAFIDEKAHPSLRDAAAFLGCPVIAFKHRDPQGLAALLKEHRPPKPVLLTDGVFPHHGLVAPLKAYRQLLPSEAMLFIDDAHAAGVLGPSGKGTLELERIPRHRAVQTITLSKAFGVFGGVILGSSELISRLSQKSRLLVSSTPFPLPLAAAALQAVRILRSSSGSRKRLVANSASFKRQLRAAGLPLPESPSPIIAVQAKHEADTPLVRHRLRQAGIYPSFIRYSTGPATGCFRFALSSEHSARQLQVLLATLLACKHLLEAVN
jgi:8-amino-7-oxononanoate synthase